MVTIACPYQVIDPVRGTLPRFVDVVDGAPGVYSTMAALTWEESALIVVMWCEEPAWRGLPNRSGSLDWERDYVEIFIAGDECYCGVTLGRDGALDQTLYVWKDAYDTDPRFRAPEFDLVAGDALIFDGDPNRSRRNAFSREGEHPRGYRWAFRNWRLTGITTSIEFESAERHNTRRWVVRVALPWTALQCMRGDDYRVRAGDIWRVHVGRYTPLAMSGAVVHSFTAAAAFGSADRHFPERFLAVELRGAPSNG